MAKGLSGIFPILNTPFGEDMEVDEEDLRRQAGFVIEQCTNGWSS